MGAGVLSISKWASRTPGSVELIPETEIQQQRDMTYSETQALSKEAEEALLYRNMQTDIVQRLFLPARSIVPNGDVPTRWVPLLTRVAARRIERALGY